MIRGIRESAQKIRTILEGSRVRTVVLITQVDPDALGSAYAMKSLALSLKYTVPVNIYYAGQIGHPQNRAIASKYNLMSSMSPITEYVPFPGETVVLVDSSELSDSRLPQRLRPLAPSIIVDHHRSDLPPEEKDQCFFIQPVGAASTLVIELASEFKMSFSENHNVLLALGIYTDTKALVGASRRDRRAYGKVTKNVDPEEMAGLLYYPLPPTHFENLSRALARMETRHGRLVAGLGQIDARDGDDLSTIADELLRRDGTTLVVVWGIIGESVRVSARSSDLTNPLDEFLKTRFGREAAGAKMTPDGRAEGGALMELNLGLWMSPGVRKEAEALVAARMNELVFGTKE